MRFLLLTLLIRFDLMNHTEREVNQEKNAVASFDLRSRITIRYSKPEQFQSNAEMRWMTQTDLRRIAAQFFSSSWFWRTTRREKSYFFFFCFICCTSRAWMPKYWETPMAWHWSMDAESNETRSLE